MKMQTRIRGIILALLFSFLNYLNSYSSNSNTPYIPKFNVVFADTLTITSPVLVNIDGIGYLNSAELFDLQKPASIVNNLNTVILNCEFVNKKIYSDLDFWTFSLIPMHQDMLIEDRKFNPMTSLEYEFESVSEDVEIYKIKQEKLKIYVFLVRISYFNEVLNPQYDLVKMVEIKERKLKSSYPELEYIRVGIPVYDHPRQ